ncbi:MAG: hypothetical protein LUF85_04485 [Bacteroides sp.]|nr:hypothetical protein [Bacteroides sp.]
MASKQYEYGQQATVTVAAPGYQTQTKIYTITGDTEDSIVLERTSITLTIRILNSLSERPTITVTDLGGSLLPYFILKDIYYECTLTLEPGQSISWVIRATGYRNEQGLYVAGDTDELREITLTENSVNPPIDPTYTITFRSQSTRYYNYIIVAHRNNESLAQQALSNSEGVATMSGFYVGDVVTWTARADLDGLETSGKLPITGNHTVNIF